MKSYSLPIVVAAAIVNILPTSQVAASTTSSVYPTIEFCQGKRPSDDVPRNQAIWDNECPTFLIEEKAREKRLQEIADQKAELELKTEKEKLAQVIQTTESKSNTEKNADIETAKEMQELADSLRQGKPELPDLNAFESTAKRYLADLTFHGGQESSSALKTLTGALPGESTHKILVISSQEIVATWTNIDEPSAVINGLSKIIADANSIKSKNCAAPTGSPDGPAPYAPKVLIPAVEALAVVNVIAQLAQAFTPIILKSSAVPAPTNLTNVYVAGLQKENPALWKFSLRPPTITNANIVMTRSAEAKAATEEAANLVKNWLAVPSPSKATKDCLIEVNAMALNLSATMADITSGSPPAGSAIERAARFQAIKDNKFNGILSIDIVTSGGSTTGYQRNRFSSTKLIVGSDLAVVMQLFNNAGDFVGSDYQAFGCGRAIPYGEFANKYAGECIR